MKSTHATKRRALAVTAILAGTVALSACSNTAILEGQGSAAAPKESATQTSTPPVDLTGVKVCPTAPDIAAIEKATGLKVANPHEAETSAVCRYNNGATLTVVAFRMEAGDYRLMWASGDDAEKVGPGADLLSAKVGAYSVLRDGVTYTVSLSSDGLSGEPLKTGLKALMAAWGHA